MCFAKEGLAAALCLPLIWEFLELLRADGVPDRIRRSLSLAARFARPKAADDVQPLATAVFEVVPIGRHLALHGHRDEEGRRSAPTGAGKTLSGDADHRKRRAVDRDSFVEYAVISAEMAGPIVVTQNRDGVAVFNCFVRREKNASESGLHT